MGPTRQGVLKPETVRGNVGRWIRGEINGARSSPSCEQERRRANHNGDGRGGSEAHLSSGEGRRSRRSMEKTTVRQLVVEGPSGVVRIVTSVFSGSDATSVEIPAAIGVIGMGACLRMISGKRGGNWCGEMRRGSSPYIGSSSGRRAGGSGRWRCGYSE